MVAPYTHASSAAAAASSSSAAAASTTAGPFTPPRSPLIIPSPRKSSRQAFHHDHHDHHHATAATRSASDTGIGNPAASNTSTPTPPSTPPPKRKSRKAKGKQPLRNHKRHDHDSTRLGTDRVATAIGTTRPFTADARHSHGLSWNSTTRDSVVDNLLFSLDNLSRGDVSQQEQEESERQRYLSSLANHFSVNDSQPPRDLSRSSSMSELDRPRMDSSPASKFSRSSTKGRRSNSSSNFGFAQALTGRAKPGGKGRTSTDTQRPVNTNAGLIEKQGNEGAIAEHAHALTAETSRLASSSGMSASMDRIYAGESAADGPSVLGRGRPVPSVHSKYEVTNDDEDAAPEPYVAAGPRKMLNPTANGPVYVDAADAKSKPNTLRKTTTHTDLRSAMNSPTASIPQDIRLQAADFVRTSSMLGSRPPPSAQATNAANFGLGPRIRYPSPPREKPGFFKRVFGSSRTVSTPVERPSPNQLFLDHNLLYDAPPPSTSQASGNQPNGDTKVASDGATPQPQPQPPTLNKKPSSFFRRRKKSNSDAIQPAPPVPSVNTTFAANLAEPSPSISSLRKVMNSYLTQSSPTPTYISALNPDDIRPDTSASYAEDAEDPDIFHSGYTPPPDASLSPLHAPSRQHVLESNSPEPEESPKMKKMKVKRRPDVSLIPDVQDSGMGSISIETGRSTSAANTVRDAANEQAEVSPLSENPPDVARSHTPVSRPATGQYFGGYSGAPVADEEPASQDMREFSAGTNVSLHMDDESWVVTKPITLERPPSKKSERLRLQPTASEERLNTIASRENTSPIEGSLRSSGIQAENLAPDAVYRRPSNTSPVPALYVEHSNIPENSSEPSVIQIPAGIVDEGAEYRERARKIFEGDEEDVSRAEASAWMGERNTLSTRTLQAYMDLFDFSGTNILSALRLLCAKLMLRGETQQFDRIITALSARWCECNPSHGFKAQDVVHTIVYSVILLNTDLHLADIDEKMSRSAYVKNTLPTIKRVVADAAPNAFEETVRPATQSLRPSLPWGSIDSASPTSPTIPQLGFTMERKDPNFTDSMIGRRLSTRPAVSRIDSDTTVADISAGGPLNTLVSTPWTGSMKGWEVEIEAILKSFFLSIRSEPLPLLGSGAGTLPSGNRNLSVADLHNTLKRTGSIVSKAPSDNMSYRSKQDLRSMTMRWQGRGNRSRPKIYPASTVASSRTSLDDGSGFWSPTQSSKYSFSKTLTSASVGSFSQFSPTESFKHSIGFANALSQAIIREETQAGESETLSVPGGLLEDESLALEGAPWAKEGLVKHKHHMETDGRKAKDRNWTECFAVLGKGKLTLFNFNTSTKSQSFGRKSHFHRPGKAASVTGARVGGGDWMENAEQLDIFILRQTIASTLPPPGYSKARPHVWALSLPSGAVHLFQVGTPEIAGEFMSAANYWSARLSKEPLAGGVSNIEYGWSDNIVNMALLDRSESFPHPPSSMHTRPMPHKHSISTDRPEKSSMHSSVRGSFDTGFGSAKAKLPGDKAHIVDWQPPSQSMMASQLMEVDQLKQLTAYVQGQEEELEKHNELKHAIELAFSPRHPNHNKALTNWQRKSDYLLREIVKFRTYMDSLTEAQKSKDAFYAKRAESRPLSPVAKDDDAAALPTLSAGMIGDPAPRRDIHTSG